MGVTIYTTGYRQPGAEIRLIQLIGEGFDIRQRAGSRYRADYNRCRLAYRFGSAYHRLRELGNKNYRDKKAPFALLYQEAGIRKVLEIVQCQPGKGIILLCACANWHSCHRVYVADLLLVRLPGAEVIHLQSGNSSTLVPMPVQPVHEKEILYGC